MKNLSAFCLGLALLVTMVCAHGQIHRSVAGSDSAPQRFNNLEFGPFKGQVTASASLSTSWIPGKDGKGMMRYRLRLFNVMTHYTLDPAIDSTHAEWCTQQAKDASYIGIDGKFYYCSGALGAVRADLPTREKYFQQG